MKHFSIHNTVSTVDRSFWEICRTGRRNVQIIGIIILFLTNIAGAIFMRILPYLDDVIVFCFVFFNMVAEHVEHFNIALQKRLWDTRRNHLPELFLEI